MKLSHLWNVLAVAELGSLRAAGRKMGVAQPAITRSIRELEHDLGATLFERHAKGVRLTEIGRAFIARAEAVQSELRRARDEIEQLNPPVPRAVVTVHLTVLQVGERSRRRSSATRRRHG